MSLARPVEPGVTYLITRRAHRRRFAFVPKRKVRRLFGYALSEAAAKHGIILHSVMVI